MSRIGPREKAIHTPSRLTHTGAKTALLSRLRSPNIPVRAGLHFVRCGYGGPFEDFAAV
jgi:hypothetical protein